jgi:hypothetical protein
MGDSALIGAPASCTGNPLSHRDFRCPLAARRDCSAQNNRKAL